MQNIKVLSKGEYLRPQDFSPVTLIRYIFAAEGGRRYILLEFRNNREEELNGLSFELTQYGADGNALFSRAVSAPVRAGAGEVFTCTKLEADPACADFSVEKMSARYGGYSYTMRGGKLAVGYGEPVRAAAGEDAAEPVSAENAPKYTVAEQRAKYPAAIGIFACITFLCLVALVLVQLFSYKETATGIMKDGVVYSFDHGIDTEGADIYVSGFRGKGDVTIPAEIGGHKVTYVSSLSFQNNDNITGIEFKGSISIASNAFVNCRNLKHANLQNVTSVGAYAFEGCDSLKEVRSSTLNSIDARAFAECSSLETVEIEGEERSLSLGESAFRDCYSLRSVRLEPTIIYRGPQPFDQCDQLEELYLRNYEYSGGDQPAAPSEAAPLWELFSNYSDFHTSSLNEVHIGYMDCIPDNFCTGFAWLGSVTVDNLASPVVGDSAFEYCSSLYEINIPDVTEVGSRAFAGSGISSFDGKNLVSLGGEAFADSDVVSVTFEGNSALTGIPDAAFYGCDSLREIVLPENLETIGTGAFSYCSQIEYINLPSGLKEIGATAFSDCSSLRQVIVPDGTEFIGEGVFWNCTGMSSLTLPYLGYSADEPATLANLFAWSENSLRDVTLTRASVLADGAFSGFTLLRSVSLPDTLESIGKDAFAECSSLSELYIPDSVRSIGSGALAGCSSLESLDIPFLGENESIAGTAPALFGWEDYRDCPGAFCSLKSVRVRSGEEIAAGAFYRCGLLEEVDYRQTIRSIGEDAFSGCVSITSFTLPSGLETIGSGAFEGCYRLYEVENRSSLNVRAGSEGYGMVAKYALAVYGAGENMPERETDGDWTFMETGGVRYLVGYGDRSFLSLPQTPQSYRIAPYLFYNDINIERLDSTGSAEIIGDYAFLQCAFLTKAVFSEGIKEIGEGAFSGCGALTQVTLPVSLAEIGEGAFSSSCLYEVWNLSSLPVEAGGSDYGGVGKYAMFIYDSADEESRVAAEDGFIFVRDGEEWSLVAASQTDRVYLPEDGRIGGVRIDGYALGKGFGNEGIKVLYIPMEVERVGQGAFDGCTGLTAIYYEGTEEEWLQIGGYTPSGCSIVYES